MINRLITTLLLVLLSGSLFSQVDSIEVQILQYEDSRSTIISKGRQLLLDKFIEGDLQKVKEVKDYLVKVEDEDYIVFSPAEYWYILYWTREYDELAGDLKTLDSLRITSYYSKIPPLDDMLYEKLNEKTFENENEIKDQIASSAIDEEKKDLLTMNLDWLLIDNRMDIFAQDSLNIKADAFLEDYATGEYSDFTRSFIRFKQVPNEWGLAFEFFSGFGIFTDVLSSNYTNNVPIGVAFDICYNNLELYLRDYIGINKAKKDFDYSLGTWTEGSRALVFLPEASLGYAAYSDNRLKLAPFAGIGAMDIGPTLNDTEETPELEEVQLEFTTTYFLGFNFDIKLGDKVYPAYSPKSSYGFIRIRYAYTIPRFENKYSGISGNMHYVTIGFGGMARGLRRER